jgi:hypothetical protein
MLRLLSLGLFCALLSVGLWFVWLACWWDRRFGVKLAFPRNVAELNTPEGHHWIWSKLVEHAPIPSDATPVSWEVMPFQEAATFRSQMARITLTYTKAEGDERGVFRCLAKCAPNEGTLWNRMVFVIQGNHAKEVGSYRALSGVLGSKMPAFYGADVAGLTGHFCLLIEELDAPQAYPEEEGCPVEAVPEALVGLAQMHGACWGLPWKEKPSWLGVIPTSAIDFFLLFGKQVDALLSGRARSLWLETNAPQTVLHGDARVGNMFFSPVGGTEKRFVLFDCQATRLGKAAFDVAYFLVLSLEPSDREANDIRVLRLYHEALCEAGVEGYSFDAFIRDYRVSCLVLLVMLGLPFLSSEISVEEEASRLHALQGGLTWSWRLHQMIATFPPDELRELSGWEREALLEAVEQSMLSPHRMNHGSWLVASYLHEHGGIDCLREGTWKQEWGAGQVDGQE